MRAVLSQRLDPPALCDDRGGGEQSESASAVPLGQRSVITLHDGCDRSRITMSLRQSRRVGDGQ
jgi:hypothetical protein